MMFEPGGEWELAMHSPDVAHHKNKNIFKEIVLLRKIVCEHVTSPKFITTVEFDARGSQTFLNWHMLFGTHEQFIQVLKTFNADEGLNKI